MACGCGGECCEEKQSFLSGLMGEVQIGSYPLSTIGFLIEGVKFSQGFNLEYTDLASYDITIDDADVREEIYGALNRSNAFAGFTVEKKGGIISPYWQIDGKTKVAFGQPQDLQDTIRGYIQTYVKLARITGEYPLTINSYPRIATGGGNSGGGGNPGGGNTGGGDVSTGANSGGGIPQNPNVSSQCNPGFVYRGWLYGCQPQSCPQGQTYKEGLFTAGCEYPDEGLLDSLGKGLGLDKEAAKVAIIGGGALLAIALLRR